MVVYIMEINIRISLSSLGKFIAVTEVLNVLFNVTAHWKRTFKILNYVMLVVLIIINIALTYPATILLFAIMTPINEALLLGMGFIISALLIHVTTLDRLLITLGNKKIN
jgi:hypothetical protein